MPRQTSSSTVRIPLGDDGELVLGAPSAVTVGADGIARVVCEARVQWESLGIGRTRLPSARVGFLASVEAGPDADLLVIRLELEVDGGANARRVADRVNEGLGRSPLESPSDAMSAALGVSGALDCLTSFGVKLDPRRVRVTSEAIAVGAHVLAELGTPRVDPVPWAA
jgi:hypothetical protein